MYHAPRTMRMNEGVRRWIVAAMLAVMAFAQANLAFAGCEVERRSLAHAMMASADMPSGCDEQSMQRVPQLSARCLAHCTSDLQISGNPGFPGGAAAIARHPGESGMLLTKAAGLQSSARATAVPPPAGTVPIRILLHAFRI